MRRLKCPNCFTRKSSIYSSWEGCFFIHCPTCDFKLKSDIVPYEMNGKKVIVDKKLVDFVKEKLLKQWTELGH